MTIPEVAGQFFPTKEDLRNVGLRALAAGAERDGFTVNVLPGSEYYERFDAIAKTLVPVYANNKLGLAASSPQDSSDEDVIALAEQFGVEPRAASSSSGYVTIKVVSGTVTIPADYECTGSNGKTYKTVDTVVGAVDGDEIEIISVDGGADTTLSAGDVVNWTSAALGSLKRDAIVAAGGVTGGTDADGAEVVRQRLLRRLQRSAVGGNWAAVAEWAEAASSAIDVAYVYPAIQGPGTTGVALTSATGDRTVTDSVVNAAAIAIAAQMPGRANLNVTTVEPEYVDVVFSVYAELPSQAGGKGNGWRDSSPWPSDDSGLVKVSSYDPGPPGEITTDAATLGLLTTGSHIAIWDWENEEMYEYIVSNAVVSGTVKIQVVGGFLADHTGAYISAGAYNIKTWAANAVSAMRTLGPGEKSSSTWVLPRARRRPTPDVDGPMLIGSRVCSAISNASDEILSIDFAARRATGTTTTRTGPSVPTASTDPPKILVLKHLAFQAVT